MGDYIHLLTGMNLHPGNKNSTDDHRSMVRVIIRCDGNLDCDRLNKNSFKIFMYTNCRAHVYDIFMIHVGVCVCVCVTVPVVQVKIDIVEF